MSSNRIRVGTRGSLLARTQTDWVLRLLLGRYPEMVLETVTIHTAGDIRTREIPAGTAGKGFFTKEIEDALLNGSIDLAVHSLKDLPTEHPEGLTVAALPPRENPYDALVGCSLTDLGDTTRTLRIGTTSPRRKAQLLKAFPGCCVASLRGNIDTRLQRTRDGLVDGAVLAAAGLHRLGREDAISAYFAPEIMLPAPGQGALALQIRADDHSLRDMLRGIACVNTEYCTGAERAFMHALGGGCQLPVAALAVIRDNTLHLRGRVLSLDGRTCLEGSHSGSPDDAPAIGSVLAGDLLGRGARELISAIERHLDEERRS